MAYNPIPTETVHTFLSSLGFQEIRTGREIVFERPNHRNPDLVIRVYTSASTGSRQVAACGKDAIRLVLLHRKDGERDQPIRPSLEKKDVRVFRTGTTEAILDRIRDRAREMYANANWIAATPVCKHCGNPCYRESTYCVRFCHKKKT